LATLRLDSTFSLNCNCITTIKDDKTAALTAGIVLSFRWGVGVPASSATAKHNLFV
jgi:hypothetical protein